MKFATHTMRVPTSFKNGRWTYKTMSWRVRVMAVAENYAMVRRKGCVPYVVPVKELVVLDKHAKEQK
jgi:hypothetical protein